MTLISTNKKFTFCGCSGTVGHGLALEKSDSALWVNRVAKKYSADIKNLGEKGNSNHNIFMTALNELLFNPPSKLFVQWSLLNRISMSPKPGFLVMFAGIDYPVDFQHKKLIFSKKEIQKFLYKYHLLNCDYNYLMNLINYCNILSHLSEKTNTQLIFINLKLDWTEEITDINTATNFAENLSEYSKDILEFDSSPDDDIYNLFIELNTAFNNMNKKLWVNLFDPWLSSTNKVDVGNDNAHPGPKSHKIYTDMVIKYLEGH
jgi:hypothetical protein